MNRLQSLSLAIESTDDSYHRDQLIECYNETQMRMRTQQRYNPNSAISIKAFLATSPFFEHTDLSQCPLDMLQGFAAEWDAEIEFNLTKINMHHKEEFKGGLQ